jgi:hypothetical protein
MAQISITIPDTQVNRIMDAFALAYNYTGTAPDGTTETKANFARRKIREYVVSVVVSQESDYAARAAAEAARTQATADLA